MKIIGTRKVDELGRIMIPMDIRKKLNIHEGDALFFSLNQANEIVLKPAEAVCLVCHSAENLLDVCNVSLCRKCVDAIISAQSNR